MISPRSRLLRRSFAVGIALLVGSCDRCGGSHDHSPGQLLRRLPRKAEAVVVVPELRVLGEKAAILQKLKVANFVAQLQGAGSADEYANATMTQLGVDLRKPEDLEKIGLAPGGGAAFVAVTEDRGFLLVATRDASRLEEALAHLAKDRFGADTKSTREANGARWTTFSRGTAAPALAVAPLGAFALIAAEASVENVADWVGLDEASSLAKDEALIAASARAPAERDLWVYLPTGATRAQRYAAQGSFFTARLKPDGLTLHADVPWHDTQSTLDVLSPQPASDLIPLMPQDAFAVARFTADPVKLEPYLPALLGGPLYRAVLDSFDVKNELLSNAKPGAVLALAVAPTMKLGSMPAFDVRRTNPFRYVHLAAAVEVKDEAAAAKTLQKVPAFAAKVGAQVVPEKWNGQTLFLTSYAQGEGTDFALKGGRLLVGAPRARLEALLTSTGATSPLDAALAEALKAPALGMVIDLHKLSAAIKALPAEAWGVGGFAIKPTTVRWLDATDDLRAISVAVGAKEKAVQAELTLHLIPAQ